jgi:hypothetical protein
MLACPSEVSNPPASDRPAAAREPSCVIELFPERFVLFGVDSGASPGTRCLYLCRPTSAAPSRINVSSILLPVSAP